MPARSSGESPCLLGKTWGYDDNGIWVANGCVGFLLVSGDKGEIYLQHAKCRPFRKEER